MRTIAWITSKNEQFDIKDIEARKTKLNIKDLPEGLSGFKNDMGFIDRTVSNLLNYYTKNETYNREKINELVSARLLIKIVDKLPTSDISTSTIYFLKRKKEQGTTQYESDVYDEYIYVDGTWELIGNTYVDLTDYYTKSETESKIDEKVAIETQNRTLADNTLQNNIDIVQTNVDNVNNSLNSEIVTRQNKDLSHESKMSEIENNLNLETVRATNAENNLSDRCDSYDSHVANKSNPHNVTKVQVGLGNVTNVSTTSTITNGSSNNITSGAVYTALSNKVDKVDGRGLSEQNYTLAEKTKLAGLSNYNDTSLSNRVSATESAITKLNANSSTSGSVDYKIAKALEGVTSISFEIVSSLPTTGVAGKIYFVKGTGSEATNTYTEYVWLGSNFERIGESVVKVDLSDIYTKSQVNALVSVKNDKITVSEDYSTTLTDASTFTAIPAGANPTTGKNRKLSQVWNYIKGKADSVYAKLSHTHDKSEITDFPTKVSDFTNDNLYQYGLELPSPNNVTTYAKIKLEANIGYASPYIRGNVFTNRIEIHENSKCYTTTDYGILGIYFPNYYTTDTDNKDYLYIKYTGYRKVFLQSPIKMTLVGKSTTAPDGITFVEPTVIGYVSSDHTHDNRYYTESEIDTKLSGKSDTGHKHSASDITSGTLAVARGGTGATTAKGAEYNITSGMAVVDSDFEDDSLIAGVFIDASTTKGRFYSRTGLHLWNYIKSKISSVLGLTATAYGGKANTAGTADKATSDGSGNNIVNTYMPKSGGTFTGATTHEGIITPRRGTIEGTTVSIGREDGYITIGDPTNINNGWTVINNDCKMLYKLIVIGAMSSNTEIAGPKGSFNQSLVIPTSAPSELVDGSIWLA